MRSEEAIESEVDSISARKCPMDDDSSTSINSKSQRTVGSFVCEDPQLPKREIAFYVVALMSIITYAGYGFYVTYGIDMIKNLPAEMLKPGWMRDYKDGSTDNLFERSTSNWKKLVLASAGFLVVSKTSLAYAPMNVHYLACSAYAMMLMWLAVSFESVLAIVLLYAVALCLAYYSVISVWILACAFLYIMDSESIAGILLHSINVTEETGQTFAAIFGYVLCRFVSFSHAMRIKMSKQAKSTGFWQYLCDNVPLTLHYTFYMPYLWCGPILTYDGFCKQLDSRGRKITVDGGTAALVAWRAFRLVLWCYVLELIYHNLPVGTYLDNLEPDNVIVYKHLAFAMFMHGQNFMLLYVQFYGWPAAVALLDGVQLFHWPDCISWVYSYSIMWRVFDRGLFAVLQAHIYIPLGGSRRGPLRQLLAIMASFAFICVFHGDTTNVRVWVLLNFVQLVVERFAAFVYYSYLRSVVTKYLSPRNEKRLVGYIIGWNMMVSCGIIFFFLSGMNGFIIFPEFLLLRSQSWHTPVWHMLTMQFAAYCAVQIGRYYEVKMKPILCKNTKE